MKTRPEQWLLLALTAVLLAIPKVGVSQDWDESRIEELILEADQGTQDHAKLAQEIVDHLFSLGELGMQEFESSAYLVALLRDNGFEVEEGAAGMPTSWWATWGSGRPVIALGSDIDGIPKASQRPGVAYHEPLVEDGPGHGEGHNSGKAVTITAALALKEIMEREGIEGTIALWPGVAEEQLASKAWLVRDGYFDDVDVTIFTHVSNNLGVTWGGNTGSGLVSVEFTFHGDAAHAARAWGGRSALDAVELMNTGWNFWREHMRPLQRSHYVIVDGGDQPNVVPPRASVWYYVREVDFQHIQENFDHIRQIARGAALMTDTEMEYRILGQAAPRHFNRPVAEAFGPHLEAVGLPEWTEDDLALAMAVQLEVGSEPEGLATELSGVVGPPDEPTSGGSDDIGDISWNVPTVTLRYPSNMPGLQGHHWSNSIAMATPIAHKGVVAGARALARTTMEMYLRPEIVADAWDYFHDVQLAEEEYISFIGPDDPPAIHLNREILAEFRPQLEPFYYDPSRFDTYLEQLGIEYPTLRPDQWDRVRPLLAESDDDR